MTGGYLCLSELKHRYMSMKVGKAGYKRININMSHYYVEFYIIRYLNVMSYNNYSYPHYVSWIDIVNDRKKLDNSRQVQEFYVDCFILFEHAHYIECNK